MSWLPYAAIGGSIAVIAAAWLPAWAGRRIDAFFDSIPDEDY